MDAILNALQGAQLWQLAVAVLVVIAGSSAASALINSLFTSKDASKSFRRKSRGEALDALGSAYALYVRYGDAAGPVVDAERDQLVGESSARVRVAVAQIGDSALLDMSNVLVLLGELYASKNEDTSISELDSSFTALVAKISRGIPQK